jgi:hypothetical protein
MSVITIDTSSLAKGALKFKNADDQLNKVVDDVLSASALEIAALAKRNCAGDRGFLRQSISADTSKPLVKEVAVNAFYAAYMEFGTGKYAAAEVAKLPADWKGFAMLFKGKGKGDYYQFLNNILDWVKRKGLARIKNSYTGRSRTKKDDLLLVAETIAWSIIRNGVHAYPFLYPAFLEGKKNLNKELIEELNNFGKRKLK